MDGALALVREHHPRLTELAAGTAESTGFRLADAQLTLARHYDFPSWPRLRQYVELVNRLSRSPHEQPVGGDLVGDDGRADELLRLACLNYGADDPARWRDAARLLAEHPHLARYSIFTAAAVGDVAAATDIVCRDPGASSAEGGPFDWPPLLYLTYSRLELDGDVGAASDPVGVARLLLGHGADPNAGYLWEGLPSPFTALTGVFGRGEQGAPPHSHELAMARLLLEAGAEPNDSQTIYNRGAGDISRDDTAFLELLLDFGLGRGDGGPWRRLLIHGHQSPVEIAAEALQHAAEAGLEQRTRLLLSRGVNPDEPGTHPGYAGRRPYDGAILHGNLELADLLAAAGADTTTVDPLTRFIGTCLAADRHAVDDALAADAHLLQRALEERSDLVARAPSWDARRRSGCSWPSASTSMPATAPPPCTRPRCGAICPSSPSLSSSEPTRRSSTRNTTRHPEAGPSTVARRRWSTTSTRSTDRHPDAEFRRASQSNDGRAPRLILLGRSSALARRARRWTTAPVR